MIGAKAKPPCIQHSFGSLAIKLGIKCCHCCCAATAAKCRETQSFAVNQSIVRNFAIAEKIVILRASSTCIVFRTAHRIKSSFLQQIFAVYFQLVSIIYKIYLSKSIVLC